MNCQKLAIGGLLLLALSVWAFKQIMAEAIDESKRALAAEEWNEKLGIYDWSRCGLPLPTTIPSSTSSTTTGPSAQPKANEKQMLRAKRYRPHSPSANANATLRWHPGRKVMGGKPVAEGDLPWAVAIYRDSGYACSGSLVSKRHILTAAHCFSTGELTCNDEGCCTEDNAMPMEQVLEQYRIYLGSVCLHKKGQSECQTKQRAFRLKRASYQHFYKAKCRGNDYALLELDVADSVPDEIANHICLVHLDENILRTDWHAQAAPVVSFGWGWDPLHKFDESITGNERLQRLSMPDIWPQETCAKILGDGSYRPDMLCTMEKKEADTCMGDSGGGLMGSFEDFQGTERWFLLGTLSTGAHCDKLIDGSEKAGAQVYTNVTFYKTALDEFIGTEDNRLFKQGPAKGESDYFYGCD